MKVPVRFLFYLADNRDNQRLDDSISWWTKWFNPGTPPVSHEEVWWGDSLLFKSFSGNLVGECFTSTLRGENNGTVIRPASEVLTHPERWIYFEVDIDIRIFEEARHNARVAVRNNKGYDKSAIPSFFWFWRFGSKTKDICSEVSKRFGMWIGIFDNDKIESPRRQYKRFLDMGLKPRRLV